MKCASDFRTLAREALRGKWMLAVAAGLVASLLGGGSSGGPSVNFEFNDAGTHATLQYAGQPIYSTGVGLEPGLQALLVGGIIYIILAAVIFAAIYLVLSSVVGIGYARLNLDLVDHREASFSTLFSYFPHWKTATVASLLQALCILLWTLLLVIPGIIATYSYAMTGYILAENPELTASEAIARSTKMMEGNRWRLFCLELSFIGWGILCIFTLGIGNLWLNPYIKAATAAFYREVSGTETGQSGIAYEGGLGF